MNDTPKVYDNEWKYKNKSVFGVDRHYPICGSFGFQLENNDYLDLHQVINKVLYTKKVNKFSFNDLLIH